MAKSKSIGTVYLSLRGDASKLEKDIAKGAHKAERVLMGSIKRISQVGVGIAAAATAAAVAATKAGLESVDALAKTGDKLGIATENLQALHHAAALSGVSVNTMNMALQRMTRRVSEAAMGTGEAKDALRELGLNAQQLNRMSPDEQFKAIANAFEGVANQADKVRLAMRLFDSEGVALVNTLALGGDAVNGIKQELEAMGVAISRIDAAAVERANDSFKRVKVLLSGIGQQLAISISPFLEHIVNKVVEWAKQNGGVKQTVQGIVNVALEVIGKLITIHHYGEIIIEALKAWGSIISWVYLQLSKGFVNALKKIWTLIKIAANAFSGAFLSAIAKILKGIEWMNSKLPKKYRFEIDGLGDSMQQEADASGAAMKDLASSLDGDFFKPIGSKHEALTQGMEENFREYATNVETMLAERDPGKKFVNDVKKIQKDTQAAIEKQHGKGSKSAGLGDGVDYSKGFKVDWEKSLSAVDKQLTEHERKEKQRTEQISGMWENASKSMLSSIRKFAEGGETSIKSMVDNLLDSVLDGLIGGSFGSAGGGGGGGIFGSILGGLGLGGGGGFGGGATPSTGDAGGLMSFFTGLGGLGGLGGGGGGSLPIGPVMGLRSAQQPTVNNYNISAGVTQEQVQLAMNRAKTEAVQESSRQISGQIGRGGAARSSFAAA